MEPEGILVLNENLPFVFARETDFVVGKFSEGEDEILEQVPANKEEVLDTLADLNGKSQIGSIPGCCGRQGLLGLYLRLLNPC